MSKIRALACFNISFNHLFFSPNTSNRRQRRRRRGTSADVKPDGRLAVSHRQQLRVGKQRWLIQEPLSQALEESHPGPPRPPHNDFDDFFSHLN